MNHFNDIGRWMLTTLGGVVAILEPTLPYILICTLAILYDCYSAWSLSRRAHRLHPYRVSREAVCSQLCNRGWREKDGIDWATFKR